MSRRGGMLVLFPGLIPLNIVGLDSKVRSGHVRAVSCELCEAGHFVPVGKPAEVSCVGLDTPQKAVK